MTVEVLLPRKGKIALEELAVLVRQAQTDFPFGDATQEICARLSQRILHDADAKRFPELISLAYWIRKAELIRLREEFQLLHRNDRLLVPRGTVFHLPPRNVDTMFVYSWLLSALTGNRNVIRLSPLRSESTEILLRLFCEEIEGAPEPVRSSTVIVSYGHEMEPTAAISQLSDVRVIWGGDHTIAAIRQAPLPPHSRELTFPDRRSLGVLKPEAYLQLSAAARDQLADQFFNDSFWFDQMACSTPRLVVWCGGAPEAETASRDFFQRVAGCVRRRGFQIQPSQSIEKLVFSASAILELAVTGYWRLPELTVLKMGSLDGIDSEHPGGGLFFETVLPDLSGLIPYLGRRHQTLTQFGFNRQELEDFLRRLNGAALDRIVPFGFALQFGRFWDGHDLLLEFCRQVYLRAA